MSTTAYRGYLINTSPFREDCWIECDGVVIRHSVGSINKAKYVIDRLIDSKWDLPSKGVLA